MPYTINIRHLFPTVTYTVEDVLTLKIGKRKNGGDLKSMMKRELPIESYFEKGEISWKLDMSCVQLDGSQCKLDWNAPIRVYLQVPQKSLNTFNMADKKNARRSTKLLLLIISVCLVSACYIKQKTAEEVSDELNSLIYPGQRNSKYEIDYTNSIIILPEYTDIENRFLDYTYLSKKSLLKNKLTGKEIKSFEATLEISKKDFLHNYFVDKGTIINRKTKRQLLSQFFLYMENGTTKYELNFDKSRIYSVDLSYKEDLPFASIVYIYDREGNFSELIDNISVPYIKNSNVYEKCVGHSQLRHFFSEGSGYWKLYYYNAENEIVGVKEEGEIKHNYKIGQWKYYNREGTIDSVKTYSIKDSVDVRFPYCLFNKKEPCF